ncbi:MAG: methyltransferase domain-containing protein [Candidatus Vogelbacteria bacterium]|nr:methyltransferase domain-containing protein [Candidatus Vogelbacteria bacterium]
MDSHKEETKRSYDLSARALAQKFDDIGPRVKDIEEVFSLIGKSDPITLEIGCGNGRDAAEICRHTKRYLGIDLSPEMVHLAEAKVPRAKFVVADVEAYDFPKTDAVFAFASLRHLPRESLRLVFNKIFDSLNQGGIFRLSLKQADSYQEVTKKDQYGLRTFYLYPKEAIIDYLRRFAVVKMETVVFRDQKWLEATLRKF